MDDRSQETDPMVDWWIIAAVIVLLAVTACLAAQGKLNFDDRPGTPSPVQSVSRS